MIVVSLIVLGFAQISRRNQRQTLDRQLSTQAFYAAETGVNDAAELIKNAAQTGAAIPAKADCTPNNGAFYAALNPVLDASTNVRYTCLMVDPTPTALVYGSVTTRSTIVPLIATSGTISSVTLTWQTKDDTTTPSAACPTTTSSTFTPVTAATPWNCGYGVLRIDFVPTAGSLTMSGLQTTTMSSFFVPIRPGSGGTNSITYGGGTNSRVGIACTDTNCNVTISTSASPQSQYYLRVSSVYKDVSLQVTAKDGVGATVKLQGAQALVDSTGKAQDVLRRIQVRVPLIGSSTNLLSDYAIQSTEAICKRFSVMDGFYNNSADDAVSGVAASTSNTLCKP
jgi:Tfp pilus assembly protein PilX